MSLNMENEESDLPVSNYRDWLLCTGGLVTIGGVGWCVRFAYSEPKMAIAATLAGSAGAFLIHMAVSHEIEDDSISSTPNWWILPAGILSWTSVGYCLVLSQKLQPRSTMIAYAVGSIYYILGNVCFFNNPLFKKSKRKPSYDRAASEEIAAIVDAANARFHFMGYKNQCPECTIYVEREHKKRKMEQSRKELEEKVAESVVEPPGH